MIDMAAIEKEERIRSDIPTEKVTSAFIKAGAGAGKTTLLTERIYQQLVRGVEPSRIAAITFTNKAANEMYDRISKKLQEKEEQLLPGEERERVVNARRQIEEMQISTIHSFCRTVVEEFPFFAGLSLDVKELEDGEAAALQEKFLNRFLQFCKNREEAQNTKTLWHCNEQFGANMREVKEKMGRALSEKDCNSFIYNMQALTARNGLMGIRLDGLLSQRENRKLQSMTFDEAAQETARIRKDAADWLDGIFSGLMDELRIVAAAPDTKPSAGQKLEEILAEMTENDVEKLKGILKGKQAEEFAQLWSGRNGVETVEEFLFRSFAHKLSEWMNMLFNGSKELKPLADWWSGSRERYREKLQELMQSYVGLRCRIVLGLCRELLDYYLKYEAQEKIIGNHNIVYRALQIVRDDEAIAKKLSEKFDVIYIDEYQDTDAQQAYLFHRLWEVSKGRLQLFYIGDAKQSIYAFRGADPAQFKKQEDIFRTAEAEGTDDRRVFELHFNYRSNEAVCEWINQEFQADYPGEEMVAKSPSRKCQDDQLYGVYHFPMEQEKPSAEDRAAAVAALIEGLIGSGACIWDPDAGKKEAADGIRPVRPSDFLLLFWKTGNMEIFQRALREKGLRVSMDGRVHFAGNRAYQALVSILEYCVYGMKYHKYQALGLCSEMTEAELEELRSKSKKTLPAAFVRSLLSDVRLYDNVWNRSEALAGLCHAVEEAAQSKYADLGEFLRQLPRDKENDHTLSLTPGEGDCVRLMNIHKAKGLEGQIVICCEPHGAMMSGVYKEQDEEQYRNLEYVMYTRAREALFFVGDSLPSGRPAKALDLGKIAAADMKFSKEEAEVWLGREDAEGAEQVYHASDAQKIPKVRLVNPSLEKRKMQEQQGVSEDMEKSAGAEDAHEEAGRSHAERPYGNRLGLIVHRVMELAVHEGARLCALAEKAQAGADGRMPEEMCKVVEPLFRFAVAEELREPLSERDMEELRLKKQGANVASAGDKERLKTVCDAVREYVFSFLFSTYLQPEYRHYVRDCQVYTELPFFVHDDGENAQEETVHGIMDLVVKEKDADGRERYIVADYKTTCQYIGETQEEYQARLHEKYDGQLELYRKILRELFKIPEEVPIETWIISYYMNG